MGVLDMLALCELCDCSNYPIREISYRGEAAWDITQCQLTEAHGYNYQTMYYSTAN